MVPAIVRRTVVLAVATAAVAAFGVGLALRPAGGAGPSTALEQVRTALASSYYRPLPKVALSQPTIGRTIASLHDRYTTYLTPSEYRVAHRAFVGGYGGIGVTVLPAPGGLLVRRTIPGPAKVAGIRPGDTIMTVDGAATASLSFDEAMGRIIGQPGTRVRLRVLREGKAMSFQIERQSFELPVVHARLEHRVGVIRIESFSSRSGSEAARALHRLIGAGATRIVLDLRGNPGGLLDQAVKVASLFLQPKASIVSLAGAHRPLVILYARGRPNLGIPLAVLVDGGSASASEVVAGALKDHGRAQIVGERTFGKSLVQQIVKLRSGAALKLTVARYLTPAGTDISHGGVRPDVRSSHPLAAAFRLLNGRARPERPARRRS
jgi:carboxyl-terminal processing protease